MKSNCQIYQAKELWGTIFNYESYFPKKVWINELGDLEWIDNEGVSHFKTANECAYEISMPLYEVIMVDNNGWDEYALLFFED